MRRETWTIRSMLPASFSRARSRVTCGPASIAQVTSLRRHVAASAAWVVDSDPVPDSIALIIVHASGPRTSPTICRDRENRKESSSASARSNAPAARPSGPISPTPGRASQSITTSCRPVSARNSSYSVSNVPIASSRGICPHRARTRVVFPADIGPETTMLHAPRTAAARKLAAAGDRQPALHPRIQGVDPVPVAADHHRRPGHHPRRRRQPGAAVQLQVQPRSALGERARVGLRPVGQEPQEVDQLLIGVGDRRARDPGAVDQLEQDPVRAEDDDVLDPVIIDQRLQPAQAEHRVEHRLPHHRPLPPAPGRLAGGDRVGGVLRQQLG